MTQGIYEIRHCASQKVYVGQSANCEKRWREHCSMLRCGRHVTPQLQRAWDKYGCEAFDFSIVEPVADPALLAAAEQRWIDALNAFGHGYNSRPAAVSQLGFRHSAETKSRISEAQKGHVASTAQKLAVSLANKGKPKSPEHRAKIRAAALERMLDPARREAARIAMTGRKASAEAKAKMSASRMGRKAFGCDPDSGQIALCCQRGIVSATK